MLFVSDVYSVLLSHCVRANNQIQKEIFVCLLNSKVTIGYMYRASIYDHR